MVTEQRLAVSGRAWIHHGDARAALLTRRGARRDEPPQTRPEALGEQEVSWSFILDGPNRIWAEFSVGKEQMSVTVREQRWWRSSATLGTTTGATSSQPLALLLGPPGLLIEGLQFLAHLDLARERSATVAGRPVRLVSGTPGAARSTARLYAREAGLGADRYEVAVDDEAGVVLGVWAYRAETCFRSIEATQVRLDPLVPAGLFQQPIDALEVAPRVGARTRGELGSIPLRDAFVILIPGGELSGVRPHVGVFESDQRLPGPQRVVLTYPLTAPGQARGQLRLSEAAAPLARDPKETWRVDGDVAVNETRYGETVRWRLRANVMGTFIELDSTVRDLTYLKGLVSTLSPHGEPAT